MNMSKKIVVDGKEVILNRQPTLNRRNDIVTFRIVKEKTPLDKYNTDSIEYNIMQVSDKYREYKRKREPIIFPVFCCPFPYLQGFIKLFKRRFAEIYSSQLFLNL